MMTDEYELNSQYALISQAIEDNGLKGKQRQPDNFTTCGKLNLEIKQYNNPKEVNCICICICICIFIYICTTLS